MSVPSELKFTMSVLCGLFLILAKSVTAAPPITFVAQPVGQHSTLIPTDYNPAGAPIFPNVIRDSDFALQVNLALINNNVIRVENATFIFQQCYSGGFLDDVDNNLPLVKWVGGSPSKHDQASYGQIVGAPTIPIVKSAKDNPPMSYWTRQLEPQLLAANKNADSIDLARIFDPYGSLAMPIIDRKEDGQLLYRNNGENILFRDGNNKRYAILFAGYTDAMRHYENINRVYDRLAVAWTVGPGADVIRVVYGDGVNRIQGDANSGPLPAAWGAVAGTALNLSAELANIGAMINNNDQFFFYATDHGGNSAKGGGALIPGSGGPTNVTPEPTVTPGMQDGMQRQTDNVPTLTIEYDQLAPGTSATVRWNGCMVGTLTYNGMSSGSETYAIDESCIVIGNNTVSLEAQPGSSDFQVISTEIFTGAISDLPPETNEVVPTVSEWGLIILCQLLLTAGTVAIVRWKPKRRAGSAV